MKTGKITVTALLLSISFALSLLEGFIPLRAFIPIPGLKLGFANISVAAALFLCGKASALSVVALRPLLSLLMFGNFTSFILSLSGGLLSFMSIVLFSKVYDKYLSLRGISVICAVSHSIGQILTAAFVVTDTSVFSYMPLLCAASSVTGFLNGCIMNIVIPRIKKSGVFKYDKNI